MRLDEEVAAAQLTHGLKILWIMPSLSVLELSLRTFVSLFGSSVGYCDPEISQIRQETDPGDAVPGLQNPVSSVCLCLTRWDAETKCLLASQMILMSHMYHAVRMYSMRRILATLSHLNPDASPPVVGSVG